MLDALELQTLSVLELSKSDNTGRVVSFLALEARSYRCPSLLPEHKLHCLGDKVPPAIPIKHSGQRKMVEQWNLSPLSSVAYNCSLGTEKCWVSSLFAACSRLVP